MRIKRRLVSLFFIVHLFLIFCQALWTTIDTYCDVYFNKTPDVPVLNLLKQNPHTSLYYVLTGINTGYGFYGIKTSTEKYLRVTYLDSSNNVLKSDRYFRLSTSNGISRLEGFASYLANFISDTKDIEKDTTSATKNLELIDFRITYVVKVLKWLGKDQAALVPGCVSYKTELLTIVAPNIKKDKSKTKPELYVIQEGLFRSN